MLSICAPHKPSALRRSKLIVTLTFGMSQVVAWGKETWVQSMLWTNTQCSSKYISGILARCLVSTRSWRAFRKMQMHFWAVSSSNSEWGPGNWWRTIGTSDSRSSETPVKILMQTSWLKGYLFRVKLSLWLYHCGTSSTKHVLMARTGGYFLCSPRAKLGQNFPVCYSNFEYTNGAGELLSLLPKMYSNSISIWDLPPLTEARLSIPILALRQSRVLC